MLPEENKSVFEQTIDSEAIIAIQLNCFIDHVNFFKPTEITYLFCHVSITGLAMQATPPILSELCDVAIYFDFNLGPASPIVLQRDWRTDNFTREISKLI